MLANWVKQETTTTGTGTITLGTVPAGRIAFGDAFTDGDTVYYSIEDGNNREIGIGTYTASGTTLSRDTILETLVSGVFDNTSPAAINLSGSAVAMCSASRLSQVVGITGNMVSGSNIDGCMPDNFTGNNESSTAAGALLMLVPIVFSSPRKIKRIGLKVRTADAGDINTRCGIYSIDRNGNPATVIVDSGPLDATTTGYKFASLTDDLYLPAGAYLAGFLTESATVLLNALGRDNNICGGFGSDLWSNRNQMFTKSGVTGALPDNPTGLGSSNNNHPILRTKST